MTPTPSVTVPAAAPRPPVSLAPSHNQAAAAAAVSASAATVGQRFQSGPVVTEAIGRILGELKTAQQAVSKVRPALSDELSAKYRQLIASAATVRGKSRLYYDYCGSGIGRGIYVELADGSVKLDLICGIGVHFFGHNDPEVTRAALRGALADTVMQGNLQMNDDSNDFAHAIVREASKVSRLELVFVTNSGAMANESALKICYQKNAPAGRVIAFRDCFMGRSVTLSQIGDLADNRQGIPLSTLVDYMPFYDAELSLERNLEIATDRLHEYIHRYPGQHACFIFELVQGEGGFNSAPREYFAALMEICKRHKIAVWVDEVQTFGRTGEMFAFDLLKLGEYVDVCTIGKMSQVCACLYTKEYNPKPGLLSGTFVGSSVAINTGLHILGRLREGGYYGPDGRIARHYRRFVEGVEALAKKHPEWFPPVAGPTGKPLQKATVAGGVGGMMRFTPFGGRKDAITKLLATLFDEGVIAFYAGHGPYHVRFLPPLGVMEPSEWDPVFEIVERTMAKTFATLGAK